MGTRVLSYRDYTLIIAVNNYRFELGFTKAYSAKKASKLDRFLSSLGLSNTFGLDSLRFR